MGLTSAAHMAEPANLASWNTALRAVLLRTGHDDAASLAADWKPFRPTLRRLEQAARAELDEAEIPSLPLPAHLAFTQRALTQRAQQQAYERWAQRPVLTPTVHGDDLVEDQDQDFGFELLTKQTKSSLTKLSAPPAACG